MNTNGQWRKCHFDDCSSYATRATRTDGDLMREPREGERLLWVCDEHLERVL